MPSGDNPSDPTPLGASPPSSALDAGIAENLMGTGDATVPLDEQQLAVPI
jgi:hypothetical protein